MARASRRGNTQKFQVRRGISRVAAGPHAGGAYSAYAASIAARGSAVFDTARNRNRFVGFLLGGAAAAALMTAAPRQAKAVCTTAGSTVTCTGDVAGGISYSGYEILDVQNLTGDIAPAIGVEGVYFYSDNDSISVNVDTTPYAIVTTGDYAFGILAQSDTGTVDVNHTGDITTTGNRAHGIYAYGYSDVSVDSTGNIATGDAVAGTGDNAHGIYAFSQYGDAEVATGSGSTITTSGDQATGIRVETDGTGGVATVTNRSVITTSGYGAEGIDVNSESDANVYNYAAITTAGDASQAIDITAYGDVRLVNNGTISTSGEDAAGILVESSNDVDIDHIGDIKTLGDDASAILAYGYSGVTVNSTGDISTGDPVAGTGAYSDGIRAESYGGYAYVTTHTGSTITTTGTFADAIRAEAYDKAGVNNYAAITTSGDDAFGIFARSAYDDTVVFNRGPITTSGDDADGIYAYSGSTDADEGATVRNAGAITTSGEDAFGIHAAAAYSDIAVYNYATIATSGLGAHGVSADAGSDVYVRNSGAIVTTGDGAHGISAYAESDAAIESSAAVTTGGDSAHGIYARAQGNVYIGTSGPITVSGDESAGILAYGNYNVVLVDVEDDVTATGQNSIAIAVDNVNDEYADVDILGGAVVRGGGGTYGAGVFLMHGAGKGSLTNYGSISAASGVAIRSISDTEIDNHGTITGDVEMGDPAMFDNLAGGLFNAGTTVDLAGGTLTNTGTVSPGGPGTIVTTQLDGELVQVAGGNLEIDIDGTLADSDLIDVSLGAQVAGTVTVNMLTLAQAGQEFTIVDSANGVTDNGLMVADTAIVDFEIDTTVPNEVRLVIAGVNLLAPALNGTPNQRAIAENIDTILNNGGAGPGLGGVLAALASQPDQASFLAALDQLSPEVYAALVNSGLLASLEFADSLMSCKVAGGWQTVGREGSCGWLSVAGNVTDHEPDANNFGWEETTGGISGGVQAALGEVVRLGIAGGYQRADIDSGSLFSSEADRAHLGTVLKLDLDRLTLAASGSGGYAWSDSRRAVPLVAATARSDQTMWWTAGHLRATYTMRSRSGFYLAPSVDGGVTHVDLDGFTESGGGGANLTVDGVSETWVNLSPALEVGHTFATAGGSEVRPFVKAGYTHLFGESSPPLTASFTGAPAGIPNFQVVSSLDRDYVDVWAGADVFLASGLDVRVFYRGAFASDTERHAAGLKASWAF